MTMVAQGLKTTLLDENLFDVTTQPPPRSNFKKKLKNIFFRFSPLVKRDAGDEVGNN